MQCLEILTHEAVHLALGYKLDLRGVPQRLVSLALLELVSGVHVLPLVRRVKLE